MTEDVRYLACLMCRKVDFNGIRFSEEAYLEAGGNPEYLSHGVCSDPDCRSAYVLHASGGDVGLAELIKKELEE